MQQFQVGMLCLKGFENGKEFLVMSIIAKLSIGQGMYIESHREDITIVSSQ